MEVRRKGAHTLYDLKYHLVWITKYRKPVIKGRLGVRIRDLIREICDTNNIRIIKGHLSKDHVHILVSIPPNLSVSRAVQYIKGKTARKILQEFPAISKQYWGRHFWARGYFATSSGSITDEMIMEYIQSQDEDQDKRGDNFTILST